MKQSVLRMRNAVTRAVNSLEQPSSAALQTDPATLQNTVRATALLARLTSPLLMVLDAVVECTVPVDTARIVMNSAELSWAVLPVLEMIHTAAMIQTVKLRALRPVSVKVLATECSSGLSTEQSKSISLVSFTNESRRCGSGTCKSGSCVGNDVFSQVKSWVDRVSSFFVINDFNFAHIH